MRAMRVASHCVSGSAAAAPAASTFCHPAAVTANATATATATVNATPISKRSHSSTQSNSHPLPMSMPVPVPLMLPSIRRFTSTARRSRPILSASSSAFRVLTSSPLPPYACRPASRTPICSLALASAHPSLHARSLPSHTQQASSASFHQSAHRFAAAEQSESWSGNSCWRCGQPIKRSSSSPSSFSSTHATEQTNAHTSTLLASTSVPHSTAVFCPSCSILQPIASVTDASTSNDADTQKTQSKSGDSGSLLNLFSLFSLPPSFDLSTRELESSYKRMQRQLHPDMFHAAKDASDHANHTRMDTDADHAPSHDSASQAMRIASTLSSLVNHAYTTLRNPYQRALHILELHGRPIDEHSGEQVTDPELLMEIMEIRESLEECQSLTQLKEFAHANNEQLQKLYGEIREAEKRQDIEGMRDIVIKLSYYKNIEEEIHKLMPVS